MGTHGKAAISRNPRRQNNEQKNKTEKKQQIRGTPQRDRPTGTVPMETNTRDEDSRKPWIDLSATIPLTLQQLVLNVFKHALFPSTQDHEADETRRIFPAECCFSHTTTSSKTAVTAEGALPDGNLKSLIQTIKSHLYNRRFQSTFNDADEDLLQAYALRWSATRALAYAGNFKGILKALLPLFEDPNHDKKGDGDDGDDQIDGAPTQTNNRIVCIGGGAGAEAIALAAAWRDIAMSDSSLVTSDMHNSRSEGGIQSSAVTGSANIKLTAPLGAKLEGAGEKVEIEASVSPSGEASPMESNQLEGRDQRIAGVVSTRGMDTGFPRSNNVVRIDNMKRHGKKPPNLSIVAVDVADWASILERLSAAIRCPVVPGSKMHPAPLLPRAANNSHSAQEQEAGTFDISFKRLDVLDPQNEEAFGSLFGRNLSSPLSLADHSRDDDYICSPECENNERTRTILITLMFTLNELLSTSLAKASAFLLRLTDWSEPGTILLVVDSPGSYSTLSLGRIKDKIVDNPDTARAPVSTTATERSKQNQRQQQQRTYPMKFLLNHILLTTAAGKWGLVHSEDSRWFRRDAARLRYDVGEGAGLEDMRFQIHIYRRLG